MNNEEKILSILENMQGQMNLMEGHMSRMESCMDRMEGRMDGIEGRMDGMEGRMDRMEGRMDRMEGRMDTMEETLTRVAVTQENVVLPRLQLLAEGHSGIVKNMAKQEDLEVVKEDVQILKSAVRTHAVDIAELKAIK